MIQSICIEYKLRGYNSEWKLYKHVTVAPDDSGTSEIILLEKAFGTYYDFRVVVSITHPITLKMYDAQKGWIEVK
jgi:hypothetical protein